MSEITNGHRGVGLVEDGKWDEAVPLLTKAIKVRPSPVWLLARAQAYQQQGEMERALVDCEHAYLEAAKRQSNRDAAIELDNADNSGGGGGGGGGGKNLASASKKREWIRPHSMRLVVLGNMQKLPADAPGRRLTVTREPKPPALVDGEYGPNQAAASSTTAATSTETKTAPVTTAAAAAAPKEQKLRIDHFQNKEVVTLSIFIKGADKDKVAVERGASNDVVIVRNIPRPSNPDLVLKLSHPVSDAAAITHRVFGTKIELTLLSGAPGGQKWSTWGSELTGLDAATALAAPCSTAPTPPAATASAPAPVPAPKSADRPPAYPTSAKGGPKNWEKVGGDEPDEAEEGVDAFFKKLYKDASPEARRAMVKSYVESNGTHLSTDWTGVKDGKVPTHPPEGAEVRKW
ncbi:hypothetical protein MAPG_04026 [Magnaporthiopsis poae ATCC 64411]|uniref:SGT1 and CS domain-containing protein n=1 Tax=Magnaporthiopsis poae (strain ATCC 64411 / 73-15) TaxID=644358 RepID=A0A0C4DVL9_MAGP6|nr:hypothetical protein MAPG_04026 [Magnaporthiopsis poae ATCC 64411]